MISRETAIYFAMIPASPAPPKKDAQNLSKRRVSWVDFCPNSSTLDTSNGVRLRQMDLISGSASCEGMFGTQPIPFGTSPSSDPAWPDEGNIAINAPPYAPQTTQAKITPHSRYRKLML
jgi:hypothetical protein